MFFLGPPSEMPKDWTPEPLHRNPESPTEKVIRG